MVRINQVICYIRLYLQNYSKQREAKTQRKQPIIYISISRNIRLNHSGKTLQKFSVEKAILNNRVRPSNIGPPFGVCYLFFIVILYHVHVTCRHVFVQIIRL